MNKEYTKKNTKFYGLEEHLAALSEVCVTAELLHSKWLLDKEALSKKINQTSTPFLMYSNHGAIHSEAIISSIELILGKNRISKLGYTDTWMLLECAYRHDTGMYIDEDEIKTLIYSEEFIDFMLSCQNHPDEEVRTAARNVDLSTFITINHLADIRQKNRDLNFLISEYIRGQHHKRVIKDIENTKKCGSDFIPDRIWNLARKICEGHIYDKKYILNSLYRTEKGIDNDDIHPRLILILLRLGDLLDLENNRFNLYQLRNWGESELPFITWAEIEKHKSISHICINEKEISIKAEFFIENDIPKKSQYELIDVREYELEKNNTDMANGLRDLGAKEKIEYIKEHIIEEKRSQIAVEKFFEDKRKKSDIKQKACILLQKWFDYLKDDLDFFALNWVKIVPDNLDGSVPLLRSFEIWWQGYKINEQGVNLKYRISHRRAVEIIQGTKLYEEQWQQDNVAFEKRVHWVFIRELVQNAMDATKLQVFFYLKEGRYGKPINFGNDSRKWKVFDVFNNIGDYIRNLKVEVNIKYYSYPSELVPILRIEIKDVGTGIDQKALKRMKEIGGPRDMETEQIIRCMPTWLKPTGAFGIGMQSVFGVVDKLYAESGSRMDHIVRDLHFYSAENGGILYAVEKTQKNIPVSEYGTKMIINIHKNKMKYLEDEFDSSYDHIFNEISNYINQTLGNDLFPIHIKYYVNDVEINENKISGIMEKLITHFNGDLDRGMISGENNFIIYEKAIYFYYPQMSTDGLIVLEMSPQQQCIFGTTTLYYRGMHVKEIEIDKRFCYPFWNIKAYIWDYEPKDTLSINRNEILTGKKKEIQEAIMQAANAAILSITRRYRENQDILEGKDLNELNIAIKLSGCLLRMMKGDIIKNSLILKNECNNNITHKVAMVYFKDKNLFLKSFSIVEILNNWENIWWMSPKDFPAYDTGINWIDKSLSSENINYISKDFLTQIMEFWDFPLSIKKAGYIKISGNTVLIYKFAYGKIQNHRPVLTAVSEEYILNHILNVLSENKKELMGKSMYVIPGLSNYSMLCLSELPSGYRNTNIVPLRCYTIFPFIGVNYIEKLLQSDQKVEWDQIWKRYKESESFQKLIDYVAKIKIKELEFKQIHRDDIMNEYEKLIREVYKKWIKTEEETSSINI